MTNKKEKKISPGKHCKSFPPKMLKQCHLPNTPPAPLLGLNQRHCAVVRLNATAPIGHPLSEGSCQAESTVHHHRFQCEYCTLRLHGCLHTFRQQDWHWQCQIQAFYCGSGCLDMCMPMTLQFPFAATYITCLLGFNIENFESNYKCKYISKSTALKNSGINWVSMSWPVSESRKNHKPTNRSTCCRVFQILL